MKSNGLLKWLLIPIVLVTAVVGIQFFSGSKEPAETLSDEARKRDLTALEMKTLKIEGDTPRDTVATLVAQVRELRTELQSALENNREQKKETDRLRARESAVDQRIQSALEAERAHMQDAQSRAISEREQTQTLLQDIQRRLDGLSTKGDDTELPVGLGLDDLKTSPPSDASVRWIEPHGSRRESDPPRPSRTSGAAEKSTFAPTATVFEQGESQVPSEKQSATELPQGSNGADSVRPVYTVPENATLLGSVAMTALVGRIPVDGTVTDAYPFKVVIGADNLAANGIELPDLAGAVASGTASGDWTLSCVRGQIRSLTFVFQDGTVRTVSASDAQRTGSGRTSNDGIGWISDRFGIPCVSGEQRSNAKQYLTTQMLITAAGAGAASLIDSQNSSYSYVNGGNGASLGTVGITGNEALGRVLAGGVQDVSQWVNQLYGQAFAAIYVPPPVDVAVHIDRSLNIDYDAHGRRVNHRIGASYAPELD